MNIRINVPNLIRQLLPAHKRQKQRLRLYNIFAQPVRMLAREFEEWSGDMRMRANMSSQAMVLEGYLRKKYDCRITIKTYEDGLLLLSLDDGSETYHPFIGFGQSGGRAVPLLGEITENFDGFDFIVEIPAGLDQRPIRVDIEKYMRATGTYDIRERNL